MLPQVLFFGFLTAMVVICLVDFKLVMRTFDQFTDWIKLHPQQSFFYSMMIFTFSIVFTIPISYSIIMLGYTYSQVFDSKVTGFLITVPIVYFGCLIGAVLAFLISRYVFRDFIKTQIQQSQWLFSNF
jgi:uncharacterized membrane protein YdjX (TVP38/TMEM64 family)